MWTALMFASKHGHLSRVKALLDIDHKTTLEGNTALMLASSEGKADCVIALLEAMLIEYSARKIHRREIRHHMRIVRSRFSSAHKAWAA